jgi:hypothetical protein
MQPRHLEGSEACIINADMQNNWSNALNSRYRAMGVFVNLISTTRDAQNSFSQVIKERVLGQFVAWIYDVRDLCLSFRLNDSIKRRKENIRNWEKKHGEEERGILSDRSDASFDTLGMGTSPR